MGHLRRLRQRGVAEIVSQCNIYEAGEKKKVFTYMSEQAADRDCSSSGRIRSEGDLFLNGAQEYTENDSETAEDNQWDFEVRDCYKPWSVQPASMALKELLESCTGWQPVPLPEDVCFTRAPAAATTFV
uniref:Uncharacterized protein n=1 Tax=Aegilops tauschii subsp. strangulata TaxID=200361 RepID=A0A453FVW2_AEGTS